MGIYQQQPVFNPIDAPLVTKDGFGAEPFKLFLQFLLNQAVRAVPTYSTFDEIPVRTNYYGEAAWITDSDTNTVGDVIAGGGAFAVLGFWDGTQWVVGGGSGVGGSGVTSVTATAPIASTGGTTPVISHNTTAVTPGSYTNTALTVDSRGHLTAASSGTAPVTSVSATAPIASTGGATPVISHDTTAVTPGSYTNADITVDSRGHITAASNGSAGLSADYVVAGDGAQPPTPLDDGAGSFIYVAYTP